VVSNFASEDATVVIGTVLDPAMEGNLRVTMVATGIGNSVSAPDFRLVKSTEEEETPQDLTVDDYDTPTVIRRRSRSDAVSEGNTAVDMDYLDIPAFLRRQAG
jgi:cell division protein FtsZ